MNQKNNAYIQSLNGYLLCLSRLCGSNYRFYASSYLAESELDIFLRNLLIDWNDAQSEESYSLGEICKVEYKDLMTEISGYILNGIISSETLEKIGATERVARILTEDISEYYGLASTTINRQGVFHPLIRSHVYRAHIKSNLFEESLYFVVKIENIFVLTCFSRKNKIPN